MDVINYIDAKRLSVTKKQKKKKKPARAAKTFSCVISNALNPDTNNFCFASIA